ncbi:MAG: NAD-dependent deacetylase [Candidatus Cloacimonas sp. SDB]|nr:MAG: NAD-dependent deacetylase [Candidatus Cloacimonas sp. SDB]
MKIKLNPKSQIVVLTGAGVSAESGLKTFRDNNGLWENHRVEDVATPEAFRQFPELVWKFYKDRYFQLAQVKPNPAHVALVELENFLGDNFNLITQNVDGLHFKAGNKNVIEMHGSLYECFCSDCNNRFLMKDIDLDLEIPVCSKCRGYLRPDIVWFGEIPYHLNRIQQIMSKLDLFLVIGTSGIVYPAAQLLPIAKSCGAHTVGINLEEPANLLYLDDFYKGLSGEILPDLVKQWIGKV